VLEQQSATVRQARSSKVEPLTDDDAAQLLARVRTVRIARGRAVHSQPAADTRIADLKGPTGGYRAPLIVRGKTLYVGFNEDLLKKLLS
jgi:hypothetical protein